MSFQVSMTTKVLLCLYSCVVVELRKVEGLETTLEFLASQMQKEDFMLVWPTFLAVEKASLL